MANRLIPVPSPEGFPVPAFFQSTSGPVRAEHGPIVRSVAACTTCLFGVLYVMPKLTLHVSENLVAAAKREAAVRRVSVSKLVSDYFSSLAAAKNASDPAVALLAPRTRRLAGCVPPSDADLVEYVDHLERKHS